ncbi:hypothetical protein ACFYR1_33530 [Streptomyces canus]|uniref:hypothetical protein n=1 Tax=Streptomyces canus TaxID=58343 RepID=UPI0036C56342
MNLSGVAAILALVSIPVSVLLARWQMRTALRQAEASHRSALEVAEANHRSALEVVEANHRRALEAADADHARAMELARNQAESERFRWLTDKRHAEYRLFQNSLAQFRRVFLAPELVVQDVRDAFNDLHSLEKMIDSVGPEEVSERAHRIVGRCARLNLGVHREPSLAFREVYWSEIRPLRDELNEAVREVLNEAWMQLRQPEA